jgi:hypothetical protein
MASMGDYVRYVAHWKLAKQKFCDLKIFVGVKFDLVDWEMVYKTLLEAAKLFQLWVCKQVMGIAGKREWDRSEMRKCPSCTIARNTCAHVLFCDHEGRVETLKHTLEFMEKWMEQADTEPDLLDYIAEYAHGVGGRTMTEICRGLEEEYQLMARDQDEIG